MNVFTHTHMYLYTEQNIKSARITRIKFFYAPTCFRMLTFWHRSFTFKF